jgi:hypothetical protein
MIHIQTINYYLWCYVKLSHLSQWCQFAGMNNKTGVYLLYLLQDEQSGNYIREDYTLM